MDKWKSKAPCFVVYREQMLKLLSWPKPTFDQLCIELPMLMAFRATEVGTWKAEYIDFEHGNTYVMDCKKKKLFEVPLNIQVAAHVEKLLNGRREGYVLRNRSPAWRGRKEPIRAKAVWLIWKKWAVRAKLLNWNHFCPLAGRRWFAAEWFHRQKLGLITLQMMMRHDDPVNTLKYVSHLVFYEDIVEDYKKFQFGFIQQDVKSEGEKVNVRV